MFQLLIKDAQGVWQTADTPTNFAPAITFEAADIANMQDRSANYSQQIALPITPTNAHIFDFTTALQSKSTFPYFLHDARLLFDNTPIAGQGSVCKVLSITPTAINIQILSSFADVFTQLKEIDLTSVPSTEADELLAIATKWDNDHNGYKKQEGLLHLFSFSDGRNAAPPCMAFIDILSRLAAKIGYTIDAENHHFYLMPSGFTGYKELGLIQDSLVGSYTYAQEGASIRYEYEYSKSTAFLNQGKPTYFRVQLVAYGPSSSTTPRADIWTQPTEQSVVRQNVGFAFTADRYPGNPGDQRLDAYISYSSRNWEFTRSGTFYINVDGAIYSYTGKEYMLTLRFYQDGTVHLEKLDGTLRKIITGSRTFADNARVQALIAVNQTTYCRVKQSYLVNENLEGKPCANGGSFSFANCLGLKSAADAFKLYMQLTCTTAIVDRAAHSIRFVPLSEVYARKASAVDWSEKLARDTETRSFALDSYAQVNTISAKENPADGFVDTYYFAVDNNTIEPRTEVFSLPLTSQRSRIVPYYTKNVDDDGKETWAYKKLPSPVCIYYTADTQERTLSVADDLPAFYKPLEDMLHEALALSAQFYLTPSDIEEFEPFTPIYLSQYGAYFYVNKIDNFIAGKLTSVELVKL